MASHEREEVRQGPTDRDTQMFHASLFILTFVTGLIDAASFLGFGHVFTANMTGNILFMAFTIAGVPGLSITRSGIALVSALVGGVAAGRLEIRLGWHRRNEWLGFNLAFESILVFAAAAVAGGMFQNGLGQERAILLMIVLTGVAMGVRNGTVRRLAVPDLTTTVLTLSVAALAFDSKLAGGKSGHQGRRLASIATMFCGAACGALLLHYSLSAVLTTAAILSAACSILQIVRSETEHEIEIGTRPA